MRIFAHVKNILAYTLVVLYIAITAHEQASANPISQRYYHDVYNKGDTRLVIGAQNGRRYFLIINYGNHAQEVTIYLGEDFDKSAEDRSFRQSFALAPFAVTKMRFLDEIAGNPKFVSAWNLGVDDDVVAELIERSDTASSDTENDRDAQPLVRLPPNYPEKCMRKANSSESVRIVFDVTDRGDVINAQVKETTNKCFNDASLESVNRWIYFPKFHDGKKIVRQGVQTIMTFELAP